MATNNWQYDYSNLYNNARNGYEPAAGAPPVTPQPTVEPMAPPPKRHGTGKRVLAVVLVLVLCAGFGIGGGYVGALLAGKGNAPTVIYQNAPAAEGTGGTAATGSTLSVSEIAKNVGPTVVEITTETVTTSTFFGQYVTGGAGSGVIISTDGYIVTNNHVVEGASQIKVTLHDKTEYSAKLIGTDRKTDMAVLKVDAKDLPSAVIGNSDTLTVGEFTLAVGNPLGELGGTVTDGIISALDRDITVNNQTMKLLQTNAAVSPGNSGGGLFNSKGELVGIVNAKSGGSNVEGLGFAIPINTAMQVATELMKSGYVTGRPVLGIKVLAVADQQTAMQYGLNRLGVYITEVTPGGAAEAAKLAVGDLILSIDDVAVSQTSDVTGYLTDKKVGDKVTLQVARDKQIISAELTLQEGGPEEAASQDTQQQQQQQQQFGSPFFG